MIIFVLTNIKFIVTMISESLCGLKKRLLIRTRSSEPDVLSLNFTSHRGNNRSTRQLFSVKYLFGETKNAENFL